MPDFGEGIVMSYAITTSAALQHSLDNTTVEGRYPRSGDGHLLRPAQLPGAYDALAADG
jgi:hypothetical protein